MKKLILMLFLAICWCKTFSQSLTVLFAIEHGGGDITRDRIVAVPLVVYKNGKYETPPTCYNGGGSGRLSKEEIVECNLAKQNLLPIVQKGELLYKIKTGKQSGTVKIIKTIEFGFSDWINYSGELEADPGVKILTNNPTLGKNRLNADPKSSPKFEIRKNPDYEDKAYKNELIGKLDMDGDGISELIYLCEEYEGHCFEIYKYKGGSWNKVYHGGYQGV